MAALFKFRNDLKLDEIQEDAVELMIDNPKDNKSLNQNLWEEYKKNIKMYGDSFKHGGKFFVENPCDEKFYNHYSFLHIVEEGWDPDNYQSNRKFYDQDKAKERANAEYKETRRRHKEAHHHVGRNDSYNQNIGCGIGVSAIYVVVDCGGGINNGYGCGGGGDGGGDAYGCGM